MRYILIVGIVVGAVCCAPKLAAAEPTLAEYWKVAQAAARKLHEVPFLNRHRAEAIALKLIEQYPEHHWVVDLVVKESYAAEARRLWPVLLGDYRRALETAVTDDGITFVLPSARVATVHRTRTGLLLRVERSGQTLEQLGIDPVRLHAIGDRWREH